MVMLNLASSTSIASPGSETRVQSSHSTKDLANRFSSLIENAEDRVRLMREKAVTEFSKHEERIVHFVATQKRLDRIICDRLEILTSQSIFSDAKLTYGDGIGCTVGTSLSGSTTTITLPISVTRDKKMEFSFHVFHDTDVENAIVEYRLQVLPAFVRFVAHDQLTIPIADETDTCVIDWIDEKLVGFLETYCDVYFHPEYQRPHLVTDPVFGIQFPKSMASGIRELEGKTFHFFTEESCRLFDESPSCYIGTPFRFNC
jgi:YHS domain-containing protein